MNNNVKFWHSLKVKPRFLILLINLKTEQDNEGWESRGKGAQNYGRRENVVREVGDSDPPVSPHSKNQRTFYRLTTMQHLQFHEQTQNCTNTTTINILTLRLVANICIESPWWQLITEG